MIPRSWLYVPGTAESRWPKAVASGTDAVVVDLEDAVPLEFKDAARAGVRAWIAGLEASIHPELWIRINDGDEGVRDLAALSGLPGITGLVVAKASVESVESVSRSLDAAGDRWWLSPLCEDAAAVLGAPLIARMDRVRQLQIGEYDLMAETGVSPGPSEDELAWARSHVVLASAAASLSAPVAPVSTEMRDMGSFKSSTQRCARMGFVGRACIHPAQVAIVHEVFTPSAEEVSQARRLVTRFDEALGEGRGVFVDEAGRMVDEAVVRRARQLLERANVDGRAACQVRTHRTLDADE